MDDALRLPIQFPAVFRQPYGLMCEHPDIMHLTLRWGVVTSTDAMAERVESTPSLLYVYLFRVEDHVAFGRKIFTEALDGTQQILLAHGEHRGVVRV